MHIISGKGARTEYDLNAHVVAYLVQRGEIMRARFEMFFATVKR